MKRRCVVIACLFNKSTENEKSFTSAILTKPAEKLMADIHDRMSLLSDVKEAFNWREKAGLPSTSNDEIFISSYKVLSYVKNLVNEGAMY
jgi:putative SOS response-associated peptidase YedK